MIFDMRKDIVINDNDNEDYKSGHRKVKQVKDVPSKLKIGTKGLDAIVKPIK